MKIKNIRIDKTFVNRLKAWAWLMLVIATSSLLIADVCDKQFVVVSQRFILFLFFVLLCFGFYKFFTIHLAKQKIHGQPSWVYYLYWTIVWLFIPTLFACFVKLGIINIKTMGFREYFILFDLYIISLLSGTVVYKNIRPREFSVNFRFSPDSVGLGQDGFQFENSAKNVANGILSLDDYVTVISLHGEAGCGKSSYVRMITESLKKSEILYSYISLTETNEGKDFSKLFSERWYETLNTRYPKIPITEYSSLLRSIFRESGNGLFFGAMDFLAKFNHGLLPTKAKAYDKYIEQKKDFVAPSVANLFGNIPLFIENLWLVVIDELERSPITETYRVIQMIERFKLEGRNGLPIKIVFLLCVGDDFKNLIELKEYEEMRHLVKNFMYNSPKSITQRLFLPPIVKTLKYDFIANLIFKFKKCNSISGIPEKKEDFSWNYIDPIKEQLSDLDSLKFTTDFLIKEPPRVINRCIAEMQLFYKSFRNVDGVEIKDAIRFSDILLISYIKIKHDVLITFFIRTCEKLYQQTQNELDPEDLHDRLLRDDKKDTNDSVEVKLLKWISRIVNAPYETLEKLPLAKLVAAVSHSYIDRVNDIYSPESGINYDGTLSDPARFLGYFMSVSDSVENKRKKFIDLYQDHQKNSLDLNNLSNQDLIEYSRILRDIKKAPTNLNLDVAKEIYNRINDNKIELVPSVVQRDTMRQDAVYQFSFQLLEVIEHQRTDKKITDETKKATELFITFLNSHNINTGSKFTVINSFVNEDRGGGSDIHFRLQRAFEIMLKTNQQEVINAIQNAFKEAYARYFSGDEVIYDKEENFFYVLYQSWSGNADNKEELDKIHAAAVRGLEDKPDVIKLYWSRFPSPPNAHDYDDAVEDAHFFGDETKEFNVTLKKLLEISKKQKPGTFDAEDTRRIELWQKILDTKEDADKYYQRCVVKDKNDTLVSFLLRKGYLEKWPPEK